MILEQEHLFREGEVILEKVRKHFIIYLADFLLHLLGCILFFVLALYLASPGKLLSSFGEQISGYGAILLTSFVLLFWISLFYSWTKNYFDVWYITNMHIVAVNQKEMFEREESFIELNRIQDVFFERDDFLGNILGYGKLRVQSAGTEQEFVMEKVRNVEFVAHRIIELRDKTKSPSGTFNQTGL